MSGTIISKPNGISLFQYKAVISAIKLEKLGMRHSKIGSVRKMWAKHLGLKASAKHDEVIAKLEEMCEELKAKGDLGIEQI